MVSIVYHPTVVQHVFHKKQHGQHGQHHSHSFPVSHLAKGLQRLLMSPSQKNRMVTGADSRVAPGGEGGWLDPYVGHPAGSGRGIAYVDPGNLEADLQIGAQYLGAWLGE